MDKNETSIDFIAAHDWMINEFGFNNRCGIYAIIYRLYQNGKPCFKSKETLAKELRSTKSSIIEALDFLTEDIVYSIEKIDGKRQKVPVMDTDGKPKHKEPYILAEKRPAPLSTVYTLNPKHELSKFWTVKNLDSQKSGQNCQNFGQSNCQNFGHKDIIIEDSIKILKESGSGKAAAKPAHFIPPTVDEVSEYCRERGNSIDAEHFIDYYTKTGWKCKNGAPMHDWKAAIREWERQDGKQSAASSKPEPKKKGLSSFNLSDLEAASVF